eukprot:3329491-Pyramimonas_sp.AAC.1
MPAAHLRRSRIPTGSCKTSLRIWARFRHASARACARAGMCGSVPSSASEALQESSTEFFRKAFQRECLFAVWVFPGELSESYKV